MAGFKQAEYNQNGQLVGGYAKLWSVKFFQKYADCRISVSHKDKEKNEYVTDFSRYVRFIGHAFQRICNIFPNLGFEQRTDNKGEMYYVAPSVNGKQNPVSIRLRNIDVTNNIKKDNNGNNIEYLNCVVFEFDYVENNNNGGAIPFNSVQQGGVPFNQVANQQNGVPFNNQNGVPFNNQGGVPFNNQQNGVPFANNASMPQTNGVPFNTNSNQQNGVPFESNELNDNDIISDDGVPF